MTALGPELDSEIRRFSLTPSINSSLPKTDPILGGTTAEITPERASLSLNVFFGRNLIEKVVSEGRTQIDLFLGSKQILQVPDIRNFVSGLKTALNPNSLLSRSLKIYSRRIKDPARESSSVWKAKARQAYWVLEELISQKVFAKQVEVAKRKLASVSIGSKEALQPRMDFPTDSNPIKLTYSAQGIRIPVLRRDLPTESRSGHLTVLPFNLADEIFGTVSQGRIWNSSNFSGSARRSSSQAFAAA